ncbi:MAG: hypothetical protein ACFCUU_16285 [Cyclobacteriaceae bacterium]
MAKHFPVIPYLLVVFWLFVAQTSPMVKVKVTDKINILIPQELIPMTDQDARAKSIGSRAPILAYTNIDRNADFVINSSFSRWRAEDIQMLRQFYRSNIMSLYDEVEFSKEEVVEINGYPFVVFEYISKVIPDEGTILKKQLPIELYNYIGYTIYQNQTYLFVFNCPLKVQDKWRSIAPEIINSIKIR